MKIKEVNKQSTIFSDLTGGDVFYYSNSYYLRIHSKNEAVNLEDGKVVIFKEFANVKILSGEFCVE